MARDLIAQGKTEAGLAEVRRARDGFAELGASRDLDRANALLDAAAPLSASQGAMRTAPVPVSGREREVLALIAEGLSNQEIAVRLGLSEHTVHRHVANILTRLDLPSRAAAVAYATRHGLL
ncbi:MAG TPA: LuxR C-terminal-related transcriptional regulator [Thermomicrobiales bacterium]|jgi:DNA-binding NarL/FixJ family response regulator